MNKIAQIEPSYNDLAFKPKIDFEDLKSYVNKYYQNHKIRLVVGEDHILFGEIMLTDKGEVIILNNEINPYQSSHRIRKNVSFEQMKLIVDGFWGDLKSVEED